ncbi:lantibiotic dehydratase [Pedobacter cryophilus]|nr:lantibiotic dehydratase [Pedobacter cryophilus]
METLQFHEQLLVRIPRLSIGDAAQSPDQYLDHPVFREAIYLASDVVYQKLVKHDFLYHDLEPKLLVTLQRYHQRMCYRSTPFGGFSAVSTLPWNTGNTTSTPLLLDLDRFRIHYQKAAVFKKRKRFSVKQCYCVNPSLYVYGAHYRYYLLADQTTKRWVFALNEIEINPLIAFLVQLRKPLNVGSFKSIRQFQKYGAYQLQKFFQNLCRLQFLVPCDVD